MSIWAEIKKAINSNLSLPLNEKIDRDIEENRISHGFLTSVEPIPQNNDISNNYKTTYTISHASIDNSYGFSTVLYLNGFYYLLGYTGSGTIWFKVSEDFSTVTKMSPSIPYSFYNASAVVYRGEIYLIGSASDSYNKNFYKFNGTSWVKVGTLPFSNKQFSSPVVHEDKIYLWCMHDTKMRCYDGTTWSVVPVAYTLSFTAIRYAQLFYYENKLHLAVSGYGGDGGMTDFFYLENGTFVGSPYIPNYRSNRSNNYDLRRIVLTSSGRLYAFLNGDGKTLELVDGSWSYCSPAINTYMLDSDIFSLANGKLIEPDSNRPKFTVTDLNFYKTYIFYLPKNIRICFYQGEANRFAAVSNCRVLEDGSILTLDDGKVEFRSFGDLNKETRVLFR